MQRQPVLAVTLLWLAGVALRLTILAVPPLVPVIRDDFRLLATEIGILNGIPLALFALAAVPGSLLIGRLGTRRTLLLGLLATAGGSALRAASPNILALYGATVVMGFGVAIMQPLLAALVREWLPARIGFGTAVYTNGLLIGEILPVFLTLPLVMPWVGGSWRWALGFWSIPVLAIALLVAAAARYAVPLRPESPIPTHARAVSWPDWSDGLVWQLGILLGTINAAYFAANAFLPAYLASTGRGQWTGSALTSLNLGQLPASFLLLAAASRLERRMWPYPAVAALMAVGLGGLVFGSGVWLVLWGAVFGFAGAAGLILGLTLPPLLSRPENVARTSAAMFTLSYSGAVLTALLCGAAWDLTSIPAAAFAPIAACALVLVGAAWTMRAARRLV